MVDSFEQIFRTLTGHTPLRWQSRLHAGLMTGLVPPALDLPTGLGKTAVMAVWLAARIMGARLPNRLVYVVDRRTVVDQATAEAEKLARNAVGLPTGGTLAISTLRGQHVDDRRWMEDPLDEARALDYTHKAAKAFGVGPDRRVSFTKERAKADVKPE